MSDVEQYLGYAAFRVGKTHFKYLSFYFSLSRPAYNKYNIHFGINQGREIHDQDKILERLEECYTDQSESEKRE